MRLFGYCLTALLGAGCAHAAPDRPVTTEAAIFRVTQVAGGLANPWCVAFLPDGTLLLTIGERFSRRDLAQDLGTDLGKVLRVGKDGSAPADNPFVGREGARPEIYTLGHRNPQGLAVDPRDGRVWEEEHG